MVKSKPVSVLLAVACVGLMAHAGAGAQTAKVIERKSGVVSSVDCTDVSESSTVSSVAGGVGGGAVGGVMGGVIGGMLFGKTGRTVGAALGAAGGAVAGSDLAKNARYRCVLEVEASGGVLLAEVTVEKKPRVGQRVRVLTMDDGTERVMPAA